LERLLSIERNTKNQVCCCTCCSYNNVVFKFWHYNISEEDTSLWHDWLWVYGSRIT